jgi:hypothetical protein
MFKKIIALGLCFILAGCGAAKQVVKTEISGEKEVLVEVEAESLIVPVAGNILATKEQGVEAAKRNALEKAIGVWVTGQQIVQQAVLIEEKIFSKVGGYIKDYQVTGQGPEGEFYKTKLRAKVKQADIRKQIDDLGLLLQTKTVNNPRVVVIIQEFTNEKLSEKQTAATVIMGELVNKDYKVVDREQLEKINKEDGLLAALRGDEKAAAQIGKKFDADVSVIGSFSAVTKANPSEFLKDTILCSVIYNLKVIKSTTGDLLTAVSGTESTWDLSAEAAAAKLTAKVAEAAGKKFASEIAAKLYESVTVLLNVRGITSLSKLEEFRKAVRYFDGVSDTRTRDYVDGLAQVELTLKYGNAQLIAAKLETLKDWKIKVDEAGGHIVNCTVK